MDLDEELDDLYRAEPAAFVATRNDLAKRLRGAKARADAEAVAKLRRPTPAAWALNQLRHADPDALEAVLATRDALERAQRGGDPALRAAVGAHRDASRRALAAAASVLEGAGRDPGGVALEVRQLLDATLAGEQGREALRGGRLDGSGGGSAGADDDVAALFAAGAAPKRAAAPRDTRADEVRRRRRAKAEAAVEAAQVRVAEASERLARAEADLATARDALAALD